MSEEEEARRYPAATLEAQAEAILAGWGLGEEDARLTAGILVDADVRGIDTHGISLLLLYARWIAAGKLNLEAGAPALERDGPTFALVDARGGLGFAPSVEATRMAIAKAKAAGMAAVTVRNSHHFGAAGHYARLAAQEGLVSLVATSSKVVCVVPPRASRAVLGTNPIAWAVPRRSAEPVVFDVATSTVAGNRVRLHHLAGETLPEGWVVDGKGAPVTDPHAGFHLVYDGGEGGLTPVGGHKGYGISLMVHFLAGTLAGGMFPATGRPAANGGDNIGHFFMALDPAVFRPHEDFLDDVEDVVAALHAAPASDPERPVLVPGDIESATRAARLAKGVPLSATVAADLKALAVSLGATDHLT